MHEDIDLIGEAADSIAASPLIRELSPDLARHRASGTLWPGSITSHNQSGRYLHHGLRSVAITAFELGAFDYLLKPFTAERFGQLLLQLGQRDAGTAQVLNILKWETVRKWVPYWRYRMSFPGGTESRESQVMFPAHQRSGSS
jgi:hypothetical protein